MVGGGIGPFRPEVSGIGGEVARVRVARPELISAGVRRYRAIGEVGHAVVWDVQGEHGVGGARSHADASVDACVDRVEVEVGGPVSALHAEVRGDGRGELFASGGSGVAGVFLVPGCGQRGLAVRQQSASDLMGDLVGVVRAHR